jgi:hypothetical protein
MRRLSVRLPDPAHERLEGHARHAGLPIARAATALLCGALESDSLRAGTSAAGNLHRPVGKPAAQSSRALKQPPRPANPPNAAGPPWLPSDTDPNWAANTWGAILALHRRYPDSLAKLEHDWHEQPERVEVLAALATWRASIDAAAEDPREELSFHNAMQQLAQTLERSVGLNRTFDPSASLVPSWVVTARSA